MRRLSLFASVLWIFLACSPAPGEGVVVASIYPLAFAAEHLARPGVEVIDLTPPGTEAHDLDLSLEDRSAIESADIVIYLGDIGFQPQVESAVKEAGGELVQFEGYFHRTRQGVDPHIWLEPSSFGGPVVGNISEALCPFENPCPMEGSNDREAFKGRLLDLGRSYAEGLEDCAFGTAIVTHEAFGYLAKFYFDQFGLSGLTPDAEPTVERLSQARSLIESGEAGAVFYDEHEDAKETAESFAADAGVPALPLSTLESEPAEGDYFTVMEDNLESLREGLQCR
jgi:zinc transport system substrate-binding protein